MPRRAVKPGTEIRQPLSIKTRIYAGFFVFANLAFIDLA
jgi:hypothetical protein